MYMLFGIIFRTLLLEALHPLFLAKAYSSAISLSRTVQRTEKQVGRQVDGTQLRNQSSQFPRKADTWQHRGTEKVFFQATEVIAVILKCLHLGQAFSF